MLPLYTSNKVNRHFSGLALTFSIGKYNLSKKLFKLFLDNIAEVRKYGLVLLAEVIGILVGDEWQTVGNDSNTDTILLPLTRAFVQEVQNGFRNSPNWRRRQRLIFAILHLSSSIFSLLVMRAC